MPELDEDGAICAGSAQISRSQSFEFNEDPAFWKDHNVQVIIRTRPLSSSEISVQGNNKCVRQDNGQAITWIGNPESRFTFDLVADENVSQVLPIVYASFFRSSRMFLSLLAFICSYRSRCLKWLEYLW
jgi:kinesin family protein 15